MKILVLNYEYPPIGGGAGTFSRILAERLKERGHRVEVVTMAYRELRGIREENGVRVHRIRCVRRHVSSCMPDEQYTYLRKLEKYMQTHAELQKFDVCLCHFVVPTGVGARLIKKHYSIPYVVKACGSDVEGYNSRVLFRFIHRIIRGGWRNIVRDAYRVVYPSAYMKSLLVKSSGNGRYEFIPNAVDIETLEKNALETGKKKRILLMGRMQEAKNFQTAVKALGLVRGVLEKAGYRIDIAGDGPWMEEIKGLVAENGLEGMTTFYGWIENRSELHLKLLSEAHIYISASRFENCPNAVLEAAASKCHMLLSDISAHRQMTGESAVYFEPDDFISLAEHVKREVEEGVSMKEHDIGVYSYDSVIPAYEKLLKRAAAAGKAKSGASK